MQGVSFEAADEATSVASFVPKGSTSAPGEPVRTSDHDAARPSIFSLGTTSNNGLTLRE
jgi:hypothetical protein